MIPFEGSGSTTLSESGKTKSCYDGRGKVAVEKVSESLQFKDGRNEIGIPWKEDKPKFGGNYKVAFTRLESQERSLKRKRTDVMNVYNRILEDYVRKGYTREVPKTETMKPQWRLPHFPVFKPDIETTKIQAVRDAPMGTFNEQ